MTDRPDRLPAYVLDYQTHHTGTTRRTRQKRHRQVRYLLARPRNWRERSERIVFAVALAVIVTVAFCGVGYFAWRLFGGT